MLSLGFTVTTANKLAYAVLFDGIGYVEWGTHRALEDDPFVIRLNDDLVGFGFCGPEVWWDSTGGEISLPMWIPLLACVWVGWGAWHRPQLTREEFRCAVCGYNLNLNVSGQCPECGTGIAANARDAGDRTPVT